MVSVPLTTLLQMARAGLLYGRVQPATQQKPAALFKLNELDRPNVRSSAEATAPSLSHTGESLVPVNHSPNVTISASR
jgi:hypothetical protein